MSLATGVAVGLDHVGLAVRDLAAAGAAWEALGFALTPAAPHLDAAGLPTGTGNRCAMLRLGYVELLAVTDPARPSRTLAGFLDRYEGGHVLSLAIDDERGALARLRRAGFAAGLVTSARPAEGGEARFARLPLAETVPRLQLIRHLTPELVWRPALLEHPNRAAALEAVVIAADPPAELAALLSRCAGVPVVPDPAGGYALPLAAGRVRVLPPAALGAVLPRMPIPSLPFVAGVAIRTADANAAVTRRGIGQAVPDGRLAVASGMAVLFTP